MWSPRPRPYLPGGVKDLPDPEKVISRPPRTTGAEAVESSLPASSIIKPRLAHS